VYNKNSGMIGYMNWVNALLMKKNVHGQAMVEFALVLPLLLLVMFGIVEFGRLFFSYAMVSAASREGARYGEAAEQIDRGGTLYPRYLDCRGIRDSAIRIGRFAGISQDSNVQIAYDNGLTCDELPAKADIHLGDRVIVTTTVTYNPVVPLVNVPNFQLQSVTRRTIIKDVPINDLGPVPSPNALP